MFLDLVGLGFLIEIGIKILVYGFMYGVGVISRLALAGVDDLVRQRSRGLIWIGML